MSFLILVAAFKLNKATSNGLRLAFLKASIIHALIVVLASELLSLIQFLNFRCIVFIWICVTFINSGYLIFVLKKEHHPATLPSIVPKAWSDLKRQSLADKIAVLVVLITLSICLLTAIVAPPNNEDSLTYHMPKVMHWIQNQSVDHYPTHNLRQISFSPGAEYIITHFQILSGSDRFANCIQWLAFLGCVLGVSLIAGVAVDVETQILSALICVSIPMAIMQSNTTQNDLVVSFWLVCFVYFMFRTDYYSGSDLFWISAALGLSVLTKPTAIIFGIPFVVLFWFRTVGSFKGLFNLSILFKSLLSVGFTAAGALTLSIPYYWRNYKTFGNFMGIDTGTKNITVGLIQSVSNILRNLALNIPSLPFWQFVERIHKSVLKIDINTPAITYQGDGNFFNPGLIRRVLLPDEDFVGAPLHLMLILMSMPLLLSTIASRKKKNLFNLMLLLTGISMGFLLYCFLIKWQMWANRLLLPLFVVSVPLAGYVVKRYLSPAIQLTLLGILASCAFFCSLTPIHRPLVALPKHWTTFCRSESILLLNRNELYLSSYGQDAVAAYEAMADVMMQNHCDKVGLDIGWNNLEYPIWVYLNSRIPETVKIKHINVKNQSGRLKAEFTNTELCGIVRQRGTTINWVVKERQ